VSGFEQFLLRGSAVDVFRGQGRSHRVATLEKAHRSTPKFSS
jgi:hypothetical protein